MRYFFAHPCHEPRSSSSMSSSSSLSTGMPPRSIARSAVRRQAVSMGVTVSGVLSRREEKHGDVPAAVAQVVFRKGRAVHELRVYLFRNSGGGKVHAPVGRKAGADRCGHQAQQKPGFYFKPHVEGSLHLCLQVLSHEVSAGTGKLYIRSKNGHNCRKRQWRELSGSCRRHIMRCCPIRKIYNYSTEIDSLCYNAISVYNR